MFRQTTDGPLSRLFKIGLFCRKQWSGGGSNSQPRHCERRALPVELPPQKKKLFCFHSCLSRLDRTNRPGGCLAEGMTVYNTQTFHTFFGRLFLDACKPLQSLSVVPENTIFVMSLSASREVAWFAFQESVDQASRALHSTRSMLKDNVATLRVFQHLRGNFWVNFHAPM